jgi:hypothetical protein
LLAACLVLFGQARAFASDPAELAAKVDAHWRQAIASDPAPPASDEVFLRRIWVDMTGRVPTALEAARFLDNRDPERRAKLVQTLIDSDEFAEHWGRNLARWLVDERPIFRGNYDGRVLAESLADAIRRKTPWPEVVGGLVSQDGATDASGPANLVLRYDADPIKLAGGLGKILMGVTIQCAQCHNHPFASWQQDDFWGLAAVFARVRPMSVDGPGALRAITEAKKGELKRPEPRPNATPGADGQMPEPRQVLVRPHLPDGSTIEPNANRRSALAAWLSDPANPYVGRNLVNRLWVELFGQQPVRNFDDLKKTSEGRALVDGLAAEFAASGHDIEGLVHAIVLTRAYAQTAGPSGDLPAWSRPAVRPLSVDVLYASVGRATGAVVDPPPPGEDGDEEEGADADEALAPDDEEDGPGDPPAEQLGEQPRSLQRALILMNGGFLNDAVRSGARMARALHGPKIGPTHVEWAFLATLSRRPTDDERATMLGLLARGPQAGLEDVYWVLLNSAEFLTNH